MVADVAIVKGETPAGDRTWLSFPDGTARREDVRVIDDLPHLVIGLALTALVTVVNYRGVRLSATFQNWSTFGTLVLFVVFVAISGKPRREYIDSPAARGRSDVGPVVVTADRPQPHFRVGMCCSHCHHQQYLYKNPNGYPCHSNTGVPFPADA